MRKTRNIFCIMSNSGGGKNVYINNILKDTMFLKSNDLSLLVYGTTRRIRENEIDGVDYHFHTKEQYDKIQDKDKIETRSYYTLNDGEVYYFTKTDYFTKAKTKNLICTCSPYQYEYYRNWCANENIKGNDYHLYVILIEADLKVRLNRLVNIRCKTYHDIYEACRRVLQERNEYNDVFERIPELKDPMSYPSVCVINNNFEDSNIEKGNNLLSSVTKGNIDKIREFIRKNS